jgi:uncharacterized membrane protein YecN with MAPEG domain
VPDPEAADPPRIRWPMLVVGGLALFGAITLVQWVLGFAFTLAKVLIVVGIVAVVVLFTRGPPDQKR